MKSNKFYFERKIKGTLFEVRSKLEKSFKDAGFGILTEIRMHDKFEEKLNVKVNPYVILGICNPKFAYDAIQLDENIGVFLPCTLVLKLIDSETIGVLLQNPISLMEQLENEQLTNLANDVSSKLLGALETA